MINRSHELSLVRQAELLNLSRSSLYYEPQAVPAADLAIMRRIDALHMDYPFAGSRMLRDLLHGDGVVIGREHGFLAISSGSKYIELAGDEVDHRL